MKQKILKSFLCLSLSAAMIFGEAGGAFATTVADAPEVVEAVAETETADEPEMTEEGETASEETTVDAPAEGEAVDASQEETAQTEETTEEAAEDEAQQEETDDVLEALGAKIVTPTTLADVSGLAYDAKTKVLSWNKVAGATGYKIEISYVDEDGNTRTARTAFSIQTGELYFDFNSSQWYYFQYEDKDGYTQYVSERLNVLFSTPDRTYTVKVSAINKDELYVVAEGVYWGYKRDEATGKYITGYYDSDPFLSSSAKLLYESEKGYDETDSKETLSADGAKTTTYTLYKYPASANQASKDVKTLTTADKNAEEIARYNSVTALAGVALKELRGGSAVFEITPAAELKDWEQVKYSYSNNEAFKDDGDQLFVKNHWLDADDDLEFSLYYLPNFTPGDTIYIKASTYNDDYDYESKPGQTKDNQYSAPVTTTYTVPKAEISAVTTTVTGSSVRLAPSAANGNVTGFEYQRKNGKKWTTIAKQNGSYTDEGLKEDTKYTYRVRGYSYNTRTQKTVYTDWQQVDAYTWGAALNLKASAAGATSVKLKWSKVPKADGYEIYRYDTRSSAYTRTKGDWQERFSNATLIKTIKKAKTVSYTDKKLTKGNSYSYLVRAYRTIGKNKCYIQEEAYITLSAKGAILGVKDYYNASGAKVVTWDKATGISGYKVEKKDAATGKWGAYKNLGKAATTITLPSVSAGSKSVQYRIRSYNGKTIYDTYDVTVEPKLAAVKNVKAVQTAEGVQVTWSPVAGADYYEVIRTTKEADYYDTTTKTYEGVYGGTSVVEAVYDTSSSTDLTKKGESERGSGKKAYEYDPNLKTESSIILGDGSYLYDGRYLYNKTKSYSTTQIKATSVVDKEITVQQLIKKEDNPAYNKAADPEYYTDEDGDSYYIGSYGEYEKNADASLKTKTVTVAEGPEAGYTYYYYVRACAKASNGADKNSSTAYSMGYTKAAQVTYTAKTAKATKLSSAKSTKKATVAVSAKKVKGAKGYAFYRSTKKNGTYVKVGTSTTPKYTDTNVTGGKTYYYKTASYTLTENGTFVYSKLSAPKSVKAKK